METSTQIAIVKKYFPNITPLQEANFIELANAYVDWNRKINVISRQDIQNIFERHILHALAIAKVIQFQPHTKILDVGTGGGLPGLPLAILFPQVAFTLIDSIGKKILVVNEIVKHLGLKNVIALQSNVKNINNRFDFVVSRAVTALPDFISLSKHCISQHSFNALPNGILYLKGGNFETELMQISQPYQIYDISQFFEETFFDTKKVVYISF